MYNSVSARQIQRGYKKLFQEANRTKKPIVVISNNKPQGAIIGIDQLEEMRLNALAQEGMKEYREGKTTTISTREELEAEFEEIKRAAREE